MWRQIKKNVEGRQRGIEEERSREKREREGARHQVGWIHQAAKSCDNWPEGCRSPPAPPCHLPPAAAGATLMHAASVLLVVPSLLKPFFQFSPFSFPLLVFPFQLQQKGEYWNPLLFIWFECLFNTFYAFNLLVSCFSLLFICFLFCLFVLY